MSTRRNMSRCALGVVAALALVAAAGPAQGQADFPAESFFDVFADIDLGPPYPSPNVVFSVLNPPEAGAAVVETEIVALSLRSVNPPTLPTRAEAYDSGGGGGAGIDSFFDVFTDIEPGEIPPESFFDVFCDIDTGGGGGSGGTILTATPSIDFPAESFFDVFVEIDVPDLSGHQSLQLTFTAQPGLKFLSPSIQQVFMIDSFFDVFFDLEIPDGVTVDTALPLYSIRMSGLYVPEPASLCLLGLGAVALVRRRRR